MRNNFVSCHAPLLIGKTATWTVVLCISLLVFFGLNTPALAQNKTAVICTNSTNLIHKIAADFIVEAYKRIGYDVEFVHLPNRRSLIQADEGYCDAETIRIGGMEKTFPNLLPVPVPVTNLQGVAFMKHDREEHTPDIKSWTDLRGMQIYVIRGEVYAEQGTADMNAGTVGTYEQLFKMLEQGRTDVGVGIRNVGLVELSEHFPNSSIHAHGAPLLSTPMYHYIHRKNRHLLADLTRVLEQMAASGELEAMQANATARLMSMP